MSWSRFLLGLGLVMFSTIFAFSVTYPFGSDLGQLNYTEVTNQQQCEVTYGNYTIMYSYNVSAFASLAYVNSQFNINVKIPGHMTTTYNSPGPGLGTGDNCPSNSASASIPTYNGNGYTISISALDNNLNTQMRVPGYINPKYIVLGVYYAPPGHSSTLTYTKNNLVSATVTTKNSHSSSFAESDTVLLSLTLSGWIKGGKSGSQTSSFEQVTNTTDLTAVTVQTSTSSQFIVPGPKCDYCGVDHDYDQIAIWLNPVQLFTLTNGGNVQPNGYGFSTLDQPGMDVYYAYVGELNGDFAVRSSTTTAFKRAWAASEIWPSGQGPALTSADKANILAMDPYAHCTYKSAINDQTHCAEPPSSLRYTQSTIQSFPYTEPSPGGQPDMKNYSWSYTATDSQGVDATSTFTQTFAIENVFNAGLFGLGYQDTLKQSWTESQSYESSTLYTTSNTSTAEASITGPVCKDVNGACSPMYPPGHAFNPITCKALTNATSFGQGDSIYLYQDNFFGTFLMEPYGQ